MRTWLYSHTDSLNLSINSGSIIKAEVKIKCVTESIISIYTLTTCIVSEILWLGSTYLILLSLLPNNLHSIIIILGLLCTTSNWPLAIGCQHTKDIIIYTAVIAALYIEGLRCLQVKRPRIRARRLTVGAALRASLRPNKHFLLYGSYVYTQVLSS